VSAIHFEFLTGDEHLIDLCKRYWEIDDNFNFARKVSDLAKEHGLALRRLSQLVSESCRAYSTDIVCSTCGKHYTYQSRSDLQQRLRFPSRDWLCDECEMKVEEDDRTQRLILQEQQRKIIQDTFGGIKRGPVEPDSFSFEDAVYLTSLARFGASEDLSFIRSLDDTPGTLSPTKEYDLEIIKLLYEHKLIFIHPDSSPDAFVERNLKSFYIAKVTWLPPLGNDSNDPRQIVTQIETMFRTMTWPNHWNTQWVALWKKVALNECLQYLQVVMSEHGFSFNPGEKTLLVLNNLLEEFSVSQAYNLIWRAAKDAAAFYIREHVSKEHAANTVVGSIQRQFERARAEGWKIKPYGRDRRCPQSMVSQVLFNTALPLGDDGFNKPPKDSK
jgi:hypothetical protein